MDIRKIFMLGLFVSTQASASEVNIYISNNSNEPLTIIQNANNDSIILEPNSRMVNVKVQNYFPVDAYQQGNHICTWYIHAKPTPGKELVGITYDGNGCQYDYVMNP